MGTRTRQGDGANESRLDSVLLVHLNSLVLQLTELMKMMEHPPLDREVSVSLKQKVQQYEKALIKRALQQTGGNQSKAAVLLGVKLTTLNSKVKLYQLGNDATK